MCEELGIPHRLITPDQPIINEFNDGLELLYRWFSPNLEFSHDGQLTGAILGQIFKDPYDISCNRSELCEYSTDVLYDHEKGNHRFNYGIIQATVESIKYRTFVFMQPVQGSSKPEEVSVELDIIHTPEECMYPHSEITVYKNGERIKNEVKPASLKTFIRSELSKVFTVCHAPDPAFKPKESGIEKQV